MSTDPILSLIGNTPVVRLEKLEKAIGSSSRVFAKLEMSNPSGSVKDRPASFILAKAEKEGRLRPGSLIVEATSGNFGISLALIGKRKGYRVRIYMPSSASRERRLLMVHYGAKVVLTSSEGGMEEAVRAAKKAEEEEGAFSPGQFFNPANVEAHLLSTGPEIASYFHGSLDAFFAGIGTGGTISGVGAYFREANMSTRVYGIEPSESPLLSRKEAHPHQIEGIGPNFVPPILRPELIDEIVDVSYGESLAALRLLAREEGILAGISSGAALAGVLKKIGDFQEGSSLLVLFPDGADRYLSKEGLYE